MSQIIIPGSQKGNILKVGSYSLIPLEVKPGKGCGHCLQSMFSHMCGSSLCTRVISGNNPFLFVPVTTQVSFASEVNDAAHQQEPILTTPCGVQVLN